MSRLVLLVIVFFIFISALGQDEPRVIVFGPANETEKLNQKLMGSFDNMIRLGIFDLFNGDLSLYYERKLNSFITAEFGAGLTFRDNIGGIIFDEQIPIFDETIEGRLGQSFALGFRLYLDELFEGFYFGIQMKYRKYRWLDLTDHSSNDLIDTRTFVMPRFNLGWSIYSHNRVSFDIYMGVSSAHVRGIYNSGNYSLSPPVYSVEEYRLSYPRVHLGMRVGFGF